LPEVCCVIFAVLVLECELHISLCFGNIQSELERELQNEIYLIYRRLAAVLAINIINKQNTQMNKKIIHFFFWAFFWYCSAWDNVGDFVEEK